MRNSIPETSLRTSRCVSTPQNVGNAVGVAGAKWFVAQMRRNNTEKASAEAIKKLGYDCYVATQKELRIRSNGKRAFVDRVVIPSLIFIYCTEAQRRAIIHLPFISRFMMNKACAANQSLVRPLAVVPDAEIRQLKFMLGVTDVQVTFSESFVKGERVRVLRGPFKGLCGEVRQDADAVTSRLYININFLGSASVVIAPTDIELIK